MHAWLRVLNGMHRGRTIRLLNPVTRFGSAGDMTVMISRRSDGYYLSHLEGDEYPQVNQSVINDTSWPLNPGDTIRMGRLGFAFHTGDAPANANIDDQRHCPRVVLHNPATISTGKACWDTRLVDLSLSGALLEHPAGWTGSTGERCRLGLRLADRSVLELDAQVRQVDADRLGMAFVDLDEAVRDEIRWLVDINPGDAGRLLHKRSELV